MSRVQSLTFPVRHYECDRSSCVQLANYLRYMQEAAFYASEAVGYTKAEFDALGLQWLAYGTDVTYFQPIRYGDTVTIRTWPADFRRVRSLRVYELFRNGEDSPAARGVTDWVLLKIATGRPQSIPPEMVETYAQGEPVETMPRSPSLPTPSPPEDVFQMERRVEWRDLDPVAHVNNAVYLDYALDAALQADAAFGWPLERMDAAGGWPVVQRHVLEYKTPAALDDVLKLHVWLSHLKAGQMIRHVEVRQADSGEVAARIHSQEAWQNADGDVTSIPADYRETAAASIAT